VGETNANLLGSMLITKIYLSAMSRADTQEAGLRKLPQFYLYVDEFQSFANESFADILSEARKYRLNLTIAHQYIEQMSEEVRAAVFGNVGTMIVFRVGAYDAEVLEKEFSPTFTAEDLVNLGFVQIYLKLMIDGVSSPPFSARTLSPIKKPEQSFKDEIMEYSRKTFAQPRKLIEEEIRKWHEPLRSGDSRDYKKTGIPASTNVSSARVESRPLRANPFASIVVDNAGSIKKVPVTENIVYPKRTPEAARPEVHRPVRSELRPSVSQSVKTSGAPVKAEWANTPKTPPVRIDQKKPSEKNLSDLKHALADVIRKKESTPANIEKPTESGTAPVGQSRQTEKAPIEKPKEIPEDVLLNILRPDDR